ncbi:MAG: indole-3-glycerol phosphate synthase TrpC, partial [Alphaproteobacteria bacterium]|nr:indole-3-glycerol phosphate synthase TrpC [Alphaproteobacteria bacterium]
AKRQHVENSKKHQSYDDLRKIIDSVQLPSGFLTALKRNKGKAIIAEAKKASPSKGVIREDFDPLGIAKAYKDAGATCLSVLTDEPFFQGRDDYLVVIKQEVNIPVLRKDFMIDPYQIFESRALGADCVLLIMAILDDAMARRLYETAIGLNMDVIVEAHDLVELERSLKLDPMIIGVNNRNLKTMDVDLNTSCELVTHIPAHIFKISESGIHSYEDIKRLNISGYEGFLIGESLMRQQNVGDALSRLIGDIK